MHQRTFTSAPRLLRYAAWAILLTSPASASELKLRWPVPCFMPVGCDSLSGTVDTTFASMEVTAVRLRDLDTLSLGSIPEAGRECSTDSADFVFAPNVPYVELLFWSKDDGGNLSCGAAHYLAAFPVDSTWNAPIPTPGLEGRYYSDKALGSLCGARTDAQISFDWTEGAPYPGCPTDSFSVRWIGKIRSQVTGTHQFRLYVNDACRVWIGGAKIMDDWATGDGWHSVVAPKEMTASVDYDLTVEMKELWYICGAKLYWTPPGGAESIVPASALSR